MTFVAARRFNRRIVMIADTKITNKSGIVRRNLQGVHINNYVPGRLKIFPLSLNVSVGYAGKADQAIDFLREVSTKYDVISDASKLCDALKGVSVPICTEFIVVSHIEKPAIFKISNGRVSEDQEMHWIGDRRVASLLSGAISELSEQLGDQMDHLKASLSNEFGNLGESMFVRAWSNLLLQAPMLNEIVGGLPIVLLGSPYGHCFEASAGAYGPDAIMINSDGRVTNERGEAVDPLVGQYSYSFVDGAARGAAVLGVSLREAGRSYLYDPLVADEPLPITNVPLDKMYEFVTAHALQRGGVLTA
jgi:hypothetical protein